MSSSNNLAPIGKMFTVFTAGPSAINPVEKRVSLVKVGQKYHAP